MRPAVALVLAKAPVAGLVKTRLAASVGTAAAAELAAWSLLDTMAACENAFGASRCLLALDGDLVSAASGATLTERLRRWTVLPQRGRGLGERLANAHRDAAQALGAPVVQVGMDTPQVSAARLAAAAAGLAKADAVLGPATDGGWWVLALADPAFAGALSAVPMSTPDTYRRTHAALSAAGARVAATESLTDVDTFTSAERVAAEAAGTRFAAGWRDLVGQLAGATR